MPEIDNIVVEMKNVKAGFNAPMLLPQLGLSGTRSHPEVLQWPPKSHLISINQVWLNGISSKRFVVCDLITFRRGYKVDFSALL